MTHFDENIGFVTEGPTMTALVNENAELSHRLFQIEEQFDEAAAALLRLRTEDEGWRPLGQSDPATDGFSLGIIKEVAKKTEVQAVGNPLLKRAFALRFDPIFSRGFELKVAEGKKLVPRYQRKIDNDTVQELLFSQEGIEANERCLFNAGNLFVAYNRVTGDVLRIPFREIGSRAVDPDMPGRTAYYLWTRTVTDFDGRTTPLSEYIPTVEWWKAGKDTENKIGQHEVNHDWTLVSMRVNVPTDGHWGVPDAFPALPYAWAYSEYIRDASSLLKALQMIAWRVVGKSKSAAQQGGVQLSTAKKPGSTAVMTAGTELAAMPKAGQVNMNDGLALAAMVASATEVPVSALLANPSIGGAQAAISSLDAPTVAMARARQKRWVEFYRKLFMAMGIEGVTVNFPKITEDPIHRQISSLATVRATGAIHADEYREAVLEALSLSPLHEDAPEPMEYAQAQNALGFLQMIENIRKAQDAEADPLSRQGNSGVSGTLGEIDNTNRNADSAPGNGTQTDLVG